MTQAPWETEVIELHRFLERWLNGGIEPTAANFERFSGSQAEGFTIVTLDGEVLEREQLLAALYSAHATRPGLVVEVDALRLHHRSADMLVVTFEERHRQGDETKKRRTTALLREKQSGLNGLEWVHVHETPMR